MQKTCLFKYPKFSVYIVFFSVFFTITFMLPGCNTANQTVVTAPPELNSNFEINFENSETLKPVLEKAKRQNKLVFLSLYADWCLPCKLMEEDVFTNEEIGRFFNDNFLNMHVDGEKAKGVKLKNLFKIRAYPTLLWLDSDGNVVVKKEGAAYYTELIRLSKQALAGGN